MRPARSHGSHFGDAGGAFAFEDGAANGRVRQLAIFAGGTEEETAAAHVAATNEVGGKYEAVAEGFEEDVAILGGGDGAEKDGDAVGRELLRESGGVAAQRFTIARIVFVNVDFAEGAESGGRDVRERIEEPGIGRNDTDELAAIGADEVAGVGDLAAKVESAGESEDVGERKSLAMEGAGEGKRRGAIEEKFGADAADFGGGEEEEALHERNDRGRGGWVAEGENKKARRVPAGSILERWVLDRADLDGFAEGRDGVAAGDELLADETGVAGFFDGAHDGGVVKLLHVLRFEFVTARISGGVVVADVLGVFADRANDVSLHDLHVVDVVEKFEPLGAHALHEFDAPRGFVAHVIGVIHARVEELHDDGDAAFFGFADNFLHADDAVFETLFVGHAGAIAGEDDHAGNASVSAGLDALDHRRHLFDVIFETVEAVGNCGGAIGDGAGEPVFFNDGPVFRAEEFDGVEADLGGRAGKLVERDFVVAPLANGVAKAAGRNGRGGGRGGGLGLGGAEAGEGGDHGGTGEGGEGFASGELSVHNRRVG